MSVFFSIAGEHWRSTCLAMVDGIGNAGSLRLAQARHRAGLFRLLAEP